MVILLEYTKATNFKDGVAIVKKGKYGVIDEKGKVLLPFEYEEIFFRRKEKSNLKGEGFKVALLDIGAKNNIGKSLNDRGCDVTIYPCDTPAEEIIASNPDGIMFIKWSR